MLVVPAADYLTPPILPADLLLGLLEVPHTAEFASYSPGLSVNCTQALAVAQAGEFASGQSSAGC